MVCFVPAQDSASPQKQRLFHTVELKSRLIPGFPLVAHHVRSVDQGKSIEPKKWRSRSLFRRCAQRPPQPLRIAVARGEWREDPAHLPRRPSRVALTYCAHGRLPQPRERDRGIAAKALTAGKTPGEAGEFSLRRKRSGAKQQRSNKDRPQRRENPPQRRRGTRSAANGIRI